MTKTVFWCTKIKQFILKAEKNVDFMPLNNKGFNEKNSLRTFLSVSAIIMNIDSWLLRCSTTKVLVPVYP